MYKILLGISVLVLGIAAVFFLPNLRQPKEEKPSEPIAHYEVAPGYNFRVKVFAENLGQITRIKITPDGNTMLVSTLAENIYAFRKNEQGEFVKQDTPFFSLKTGLPGFPPEESGLSGMVLGADFDGSTGSPSDRRDIFLLHTAVAGEEILKNRITRITFTEKPEGVFGENPVQIFEGNTDSELSHQIQGGVGLMIQEKPHLLFNIGDAVNAKQSHDLSKEAGKVMLIQRDGSAPLGPRPYPRFPKVQAIGLRNAFDIAVNPFDPLKRFAIGDTGTDRFDRFLYGKVIDLDGKKQNPIDLRWDGSNESLEKEVPDTNTKGAPDMALHRWDPTETLDDVVFYSGGTGGIPGSNASTSYILLALWGKTGSTELTPGKAVKLGVLTGFDAQPTLELRDFIRRAPAGEGKMGHPLGVGVDPKTKIIYFGDILEGRIYKVEPLP